MKIRLILFLLITGFTQICISQSNEPRNIYNPFSNNFAITTEGGVTLQRTDYKYLKTNYIVKGSLEYYFPSRGVGLFSLRAFGGGGIISGIDGRFIPNRFNTTLYYAGGGIGYTISVSDVFYPYLAAGVLVNWYSPKDNDGHILTKISDRAMGSYMGELGLRFMISENMSLNLSGQTILFAKDYIDNIQAGSSNDVAITVTAGLSFYFGRDNDSDNDGVFDYRDACPNTPANVKVDAFGCPLDSDGDGVPDYLDKCPNTPNGVKVDASGCPLDADKDGVTDDKDKCPNTPYGVKVDENGCPIDSDNDGVPDYLDKCPGTQSGVTVDADGCPLDSDNDGVPDYLDKCPNTPSGVQVDKDGCPIQKPETVIKNFVLKGDANFASGKSELLPSAYTSLDNVVKTMLDNPKLKWSVEGYTDSKGSEASNLKLSRARAQSVIDYLVSKGVNQNSLVLRAFGEANPVVPNTTAENRAMNRRVEIRILPETNKE